MAQKDIFCPDCLPATLTPSAERRVEQPSDRKYLALILANLVALIETDESAPATPNVTLLEESDTLTIPAGAMGWTVTFLTGTGTIGGAAVPAGFSDSDTHALKTSLVVTTDAGSSAYVRYNT